MDKIVIWLLVAVALLAVVAVVLIIVFVSMSHRKTGTMVGPLKSVFTGPIDLSNIDVDGDKSSIMKKLYSDHKKVDPIILNGTIFVAISSYRDPELCVTLDDLWSKAQFPNRVFVGVVEQNDVKDDKRCFSLNSTIDKKNLRIYSMHYKNAKGPTWARHLCERELFKNEDFYFLGDSHLRFEPAWDVQLIEMLQKCPRPKKTVITMYPQGFERVVNNETGVISYKVPARRDYRVSRFKYFNADGMFEFESLSSTAPKNMKHPPHTGFWAACFSFSHSDALKVAPFSPNTPMLFFGEELLMNMRYYTHGFDIRAPTHSVVYHLWKREYRKTYWGDVNNEAIRKNSIQIVKDMMLGTKDDLTYGLGSARSLSQFWDYVGLDPFAKKPTRQTFPWIPPKGYPE